MNLNSALFLWYNYLKFEMFSSKFIGIKLNQKFELLIYTCFPELVTRPYPNQTLKTDFS